MLRSYEEHQLYYYNYADPLALPPQAFHDTIINEWAEWWRWQIEELKQRALNKWEDEDIRRHRKLDAYVDEGVE